jgi:hypothetical protein
MAFSRGVLESLGNKHIRPVLQDWTFKGDPFLYMCLENQVVQLDGGTSIVLPGIIKEGNVEDYDRGDVTTIEAQDGYNSAQAEWSWTRATTALYETDIDKNEGEGVINLLNAEKERLRASLTEGMSDRVFGSNSSNSKTTPGLQDLYGASGTTYLGMLDTDLTSPATWLSSILTPLVTGTFNANEMRRMRGTVTRGGSKPNLFVCNFPMYNRIWKEAQDDQRFGMEDTANLGFDVMLFERVPIVADEHASGSGYGTADNWLMGLNMDHFKIAIHRNKNFALRVYDPLPMQEAWIMKILLGWTVYTDNRRTNSVIKTFNPSL